MYSPMEILSSKCAFKQKLNDILCLNKYKKFYYIRYIMCYSIIVYILSYSSLSFIFYDKYLKYFA